jgi:hypothetical protein
MASSRKINLERVRASLDAVCPKCGALIPPAEVRRIDFERIECPLCGEKICAQALKGESRLVRACKNGPTPPRLSQFLHWLGSV